MKAKVVLSIALILLVMQGCIVKSLHPFFRSSDVVFRNELLSTWTDQDGGKWKIIDYKGEHQAYELQYTNNDKMNAVFLGHLFTLDNELYLDFLPIGDNREGMLMFDLHMLPTHSIAHVDILNNNEIQIRWFNEKWMRSLFMQNRIKISHELIPDEDPSSEDDNAYVLTASTDELQKFVVKYGKEDKAFIDDNTVWLKLKR